MYNFHENIKKMNYKEFLSFVGYTIYYKLTFYNDMPEDIIIVISHKDDDENLGRSIIGSAGANYYTSYLSIDRLIDDAYKFLLEKYSNNKTSIFNKKNNFVEELKELKKIDMNTQKGRIEFKDTYLNNSNTIFNEDIMIHLPFKKGDKLYLLKHNFINDLINGYEEIEINDIYCYYNYSNPKYLILKEKGSFKSDYENFVFNPTYLYKQGDKYFSFQVNSDGTIKNEVDSWSLFKTKQEAINKQREIANLINESVNRLVF